MTTYTYALSRAERVWLLFSVTLLTSAAFYGILSSHMIGVMTPPEIVTYLLDFPVLMLIALSAGFFLTATGLYACRMTMSRKPREEIA